MHFEILEYDLFEKRLKVGPRLVTVNVGITVGCQHGADVGVLEFHRPR
jgi:hypothetical protein